MAAIKNKAEEVVNRAIDSAQHLMGKEQKPNPGERKVHGFAVYGPGQALRPFSYIAKALGPMECEIKIECCGVCHTDISMINNELGVSKFPFVPGHEIVGTITEVGSQVTELRPGMRVGVGWFRDADFSCEYCLRGDDNLCTNGVDTIGKGNHGGWADYIRVNSRLAVPIPDAIPSVGAAPLLCAGVTVYSPLVNHGVKAGMTVGLIGMGGLGHIFVQIASAMGCNVVVLSTSEEKEVDAKRFGAARFVNTKDTHAMGEMKEKLDFLLSTLYVEPDWNMLLDCVKAGGTLCVVGWVPITKPMGIPPFPLIYRQKQVVGSNVGSIKNLKNCLEFCAQHGITAETEVLSVSRVDDAVAGFKSRPRSNRYRLVLRMDEARWAEE